MNHEELTAEIGSYLRFHIDNGYWVGLSEETRSACVFCGFTDVSARMPGLKIENIAPGALIIGAIAEQALYLSRNYSDIAVGKVATSEGVEGISTGYTLLNSADIGFSPRAAVILEQVKREKRASGVRLVRG